jgi:hypothetical protein
MRYEANLTDTDRIVVSGVRGLKSRPFTKRFRTLAAFASWCDTEAAADYEVHSVVRDDACR